MERVFIFIEELHALLFAHKVMGICQPRLDESTGEHVVRLTVDDENLSFVLAQFAFVKTMQDEKHYIDSVRRPRMFKTNEDRFVRFNFRCTRVLIRHPIGGISTVTHILRNGRNKFTYVSPYGFRVELHHPENFRDWSINQWGERLTKQIFMEIAS